MRRLSIVEGTCPAILTLALVLVHLAFGRTAATGVGSVKGRVVDKETGAGLPCVGVWIDTVRQFDISSPDGFFDVTDIVQGEYSVYFWLPGYQSVQVNGVPVVSDSATEMTVTLWQECVTPGAVVAAESEREVMVTIGPTYEVAIDDQYEVVVVSEINVDDIIAFTVAILSRSRCESQISNDRVESGSKRGTREDTDPRRDEECGDSGSGVVYFDVRRLNATSGAGCNDVDANGVIDIKDAVYLINYLLSDGPAPEPRQACDADTGGILDLDDAVFLISHIFANNKRPTDTHGE